MCILTHDLGMKQQVPARKNHTEEATLMLQTDGSGQKQHENKHIIEMWDLNKAACLGFWRLFGSEYQILI